VTTTVDIRRALAVPGWMTEQELTWLAREAARARRIVELGSWRGRSARALADNTSGTVFCVDTWSDDATGIPGYWTTTEERPDGPDWLWREFKKNINGSPRVVTLRMTTRRAAGFAKGTGMQFDMVFIDASHDQQSVREDIQDWRPLLRPGGLLCGHDYGHPDCPEVKPVVDALVGKVKLCGTIWSAA
jgi:predicted O-methyltransferase YrrM